MEVGNNGYGKIYETTHWGQASTPKSTDDNPNTISWNVKLINYLKSLFN